LQQLTVTNLIGDIDMGEPHGLFFGGFSAGFRRCDVSACAAIEG
jgi:hypothetical protein